MSLLNFSRAVVPSPVPEETAREADAPQLFDFGATYVFAETVYQARRDGEMWLLSDLGKSFGDKTSGFFCGFILNAGTLYQAEYFWQKNRRWWRIEPKAVDIPVSDFVRCAVEIRRIDFNAD